MRVMIKRIFYVTIFLILFLPSLSLSEDNRSSIYRISQNDGKSYNLHSLVTSWFGGDTFYFRFSLEDNKESSEINISDVRKILLTGEIMITGSPGEAYGAPGMGFGVSGGEIYWKKSEIYLKNGTKVNCYLKIGDLMGTLADCWTPIDKYKNCIWDPTTEDWVKINKIESLK